MFTIKICFRVWLEGVLPMVMDREVGAQEKCLQLLEDVILRNITTPSKYTYLSLSPSLSLPLPSSLTHSLCPPLFLSSIVI